MEDIFNKICHARKGIHFCFKQNCDNCKYYINLLKELDENDSADEENSNNSLFNKK